MSDKKRIAERTAGDGPCIRLEDGLVGRPKARRFRLEQHRQGSPFHWLRSLDEPDLALAVIYAAEHFEDYSFELPDADARQLELDGTEDALVLTTVSVDNRSRAVYTNLLGPIIVNRKTLAARQVVLADDEYCTRQVLFQSTHPADSGEEGRAEAA